MSDVERISSIPAVDSATTVGETKGKPSVKKPANSGKRWGAIELEMLWAHRHFSHEQSWYRQCDCERCEGFRRTGEMPVEGSEVRYKKFAKMVQRTEQACRLIVHHINKDVVTGAISLEDALAAKTLPSQRALAKHKQAAAEKKACSRKDASACKPLPGRASKPQKQVSAESTALSPVDAVPEKPTSSSTCDSQKHASAEKRAVSPEDALAKKPQSVKASKVRKQGTAERKAVSPKHASAKKLPSRSAFKPRCLSNVEKILQFRSEEGGRVDPPPAEPPVEPHTEEDLEAANTLMGMNMQEQVPDSSATARHDSFVAGSSFGRLRIAGPSTSSTETVEDRSISSAEAFRSYYVEDRDRA